MGVVITMPYRQEAGGKVFLKRKLYENLCIAIRKWTKANERFF